MNMDYLFDRYMSEVAPYKAPRTYKDNQREIKHLSSFFGDMIPSAVTPVIVYRYLDTRGLKARTRANREKALLSHIFTMAIRWGMVEHNPCRNVQRLREMSRDRYVTDEEFLAVQQISSDLIRDAMELAYITGLRKGDMLRIKKDHLTEVGIKVKINKTRKKKIIPWTPALRKCVDRILNLPKTQLGKYLFCNKKGLPYTIDGFDSLWQRAIRKAIEKGVISERFRFHDIRRKTATDADRMYGRERARVLLDHDSQRTTAIYISGWSICQPLR